VALIYHVCVGTSRVLLASPAKGYTKVLIGCYPTTSLTRLHDMLLLLNVSYKILCGIEFDE
jgi:hypothetical protein